MIVRASIPFKFYLADEVSFVDATRFLGLHGEIVPIAENIGQGARFVRARCLQLDKSMGSLALTRLFSVSKVGRLYPPTVAIHVNADH